MKDKKILVLGSTGMVGSSILRHLHQNKFRNLYFPKRNELNLFDADSVRKYFTNHKFDFIFMCAAKVGGIKVNSEQKADFIYENLLIQVNVINNAYLSGTKEMLFYGSSCIYPRDCEQPIKEEYLLSGKLEKTNESYAISKIAGIKMCQSYNYQFKTNYKSVMPTNLYGPGDNYDLNSSHVIPALIQKTYQAKKNKSKNITLWGTGKAKRDILHVNDLARASIIIMENIKTCDDIINVGSGSEYSIHDLAKIIIQCAGFNGNIVYDETMPDGTPRKILNIEKISALGWKPNISLKDGIKEVYKEKFSR
tara:strand:- start:836 stop:1759 length:924 start_codon:yes stop_codon:yes gene_type:complete